MLTCSSVAAGPHSATPPYLGWAISTTAAAVGQTDLQAATNKLRKAMDSGYPPVSAATVTWRATSAPATRTGRGRSGACSNAAAAGTMLNRKVTSLGTKTSAATWQLTVSPPSPDLPPGDLREGERVTTHVGSAYATRVGLSRPARPGITGHLARASSAGPPSPLPSGVDVGGDQDQDERAGRVGYQVATGSGTTSGTWTGARPPLVWVLRDHGGIGAAAVDAATLPALTLTGSSSWVGALQSGQRARCRRSPRG